MDLYVSSVENGMVLEVAYVVIKNTVVHIRKNHQFYIVPIAVIPIDDQTI